MKFMVVVNQKYLVTVEAQTEGSAEHVILDDVYYGIETCQAFSINSLQTDTFTAFAKDCETVSLAELKEKAKKYQEKCKRIEKTKDKIASYKKAMNQHERAIQEIKASLEILENNLNMQNTEAKTII